MWCLGKGGLRRSAFIWMTTTFWVAMICVASLKFTTMRFPCQQNNKQKIEFYYVLKNECHLHPIFKSILNWNFPYTLVFSSVPFVSQNFCCSSRDLKEKVSFFSHLVTPRITLTLVNLVQKGGFFSFPILFYSVPPDKKLMEISFATHHWPAESFFSFMNKSKGEEIIFY